MKILFVPEWGNSGCAINEKENNIAVVSITYGKPDGVTARRAASHVLMMKKNYVGKLYLKATDNRPPTCDRFHLPMSDTVVISLRGTMKVLLSSTEAASSSGVDPARRTSQH